MKGLIVILALTVTATQHYDHGISHAGKATPISELESSSFVPVEVLMNEVNIGIR
jgi:hypothetical protein